MIEVDTKDELMLTDNLLKVKLEKIEELQPTWFKNMGNFYNRQRTKYFFIPV